MAEEFLNGADIVTGFEQVGGKRMPEGMAGNVFIQPSTAGGLFDGFLQGTGGHVVSAQVTAARINGQPGRKENKLPGPFRAGVRVFSGQGVGEKNTAMALVEILLVQLTCAGQMVLKRIDQ